MITDNKGWLAKQIAFGYGVAISVLIGLAGISVLGFLTWDILGDHKAMIEAKERFSNETYLSGNQYKPGAAENETWFYEHSYDLSREQGMTFIPVGAGLLILAAAIAYVPISLYAENGRELLRDHNPKKR